jgi:hypothetical protein
MLTSFQELSGSNSSKAKANDDFMSFSADSAFGTNGGSNDPEIDFERLVKGTSGTTGSSNALDGGWDATPSKLKSDLNVEASKTDIYQTQQFSHHEMFQTMLKNLHLPGQPQALLQHPCLVGQLGS